MNEENERRVNVRMARRQQQKKETRMRFIKIGSAVAVFLIVIGAIAGLYFHGKNQSSAKSAVVKPSETTSKKATSTTKTTSTTEDSSTQASEKGTLEKELQSILTTYTQKIKEQTPRLIEEYQAEIQNNQNGVTGLSAIANQKARELQAISDEGINQLQKKYQTAETKDGIDLSTWVNQLSANYTEHVAQISDIYLRTSASLQAENSSSQETSETDTETEQTTESSTTTPSSTHQEMQDQSTSASSSEQYAQGTTVVQQGEGPTQIAQRTGVPVETILSLNGMTMDDYFFKPGNVLKLN
ncbi:LysM peptidoglycan-binding domain-containing protein [Enterococcus villorum]|uniref:LysM peptidoglycan-binding domain-containing protein n=1 Tax=Enterococcus villorum TaxID=112904 RepID=UPI003F8A21C3